MAFGLYKSGQGYWTRVMSAIGAGILGLAGAAWAAQQAGARASAESATYVQGVVGGVIVILTAAVVWWLVGKKRQTVEFFIATEGEMQKVNWSTRREVTGSTWVVIGVSVVIAVVLFITDLLFSAFFRFIDVLEV
jgi:preprotein translocase SecE subunit